MKKIIVLLMLVLALCLGASCSAPPAPDGSVEPYIPQDEGEAIEDVRDPLEIKAQEILDTLTAEEKIGQLLVVGFPQGTGREALADYIARYKVSGFILFRRNYTDLASQYELVKSLKELNSGQNPLPLFIAIDEEGGSVSRLPKGGTHFPDARLVGKADDPELTRRTGEIVGRELKASGINMNFAPVLDIVSSSDNKLLIKRSYGSTAESVSLHGTAFINGLQSSGVIAVPKHFPGHGATVVDSHGKLPVIDIDYETFHSRELVPFTEAVKNGTDVIMVGHLAYPKLDSSGLPATMSRYFLTEVLRAQLDFKGIAISDDIEMSAYAGKGLTLEECIVASFNAGLDVFLIGGTKEVQERVLNALTEALRDGGITQERLDESVLRIIKVKLKHKLSDQMEYSLEEAGEILGNKEHKAFLEELNKAVNK